ncbi:MAG: hypothetical protein NDJ92_04845 [Thermoanaerobaculia bacterium]|nr:hypothetical protein [Thermoanaerobaculia bacterium]
MAPSETMPPESGNDLAPTRRVLEPVRSRILRFAFRVQLPALFLLALAFPATAAQPQLPLLVERALETMERSEQDGYAFRMSKVESGLTSVATFDPAKPPATAWDLLQKDGRTPTPKEIESFRKEREEREKKRDEQRKKDAKKKGSGDRELRELIAPGSLQLISETADRAIYRFTMQSDDEDMKAMVESIRGTLAISKAAPHVESLDLASTGEMRPMPGVKIAEFRLTLAFLPPDAHGRALPSTIRSVVKGRAMLVKKIDQDVSVTYSDYALRQKPGGITAPAR